MLPSAIFSGLSGLASTFLTHRSQSAAEQNAFDRMARYNDPANQLQRLRAAGLNPNLIYGSGSQSASGNISSSPLQQRAPYNLGDMASKYLEYQAQVLSNQVARRTISNLEAQNQLLFSQAREVDAKTGEAIARTKGITHENDLLDRTGASRSDNFIFRFGTRTLRDLTDRFTGFGDRFSDGLSSFKERMAKIFKKR